MGPSAKEWRSSGEVANSIYARRWLVNSAKMTPHSPSQQIIIFEEDKFSRRCLQITFPAPINLGNTSHKKETPHHWEREGRHRREQER